MPRTNRAPILTARELGALLAHQARGVVLEAAAQGRAPDLDTLGRSVLMAATASVLRAQHERAEHGGSSPEPETERGACLDVEGIEL